MALHHGRQEHRPAQDQSVNFGAVRAECSWTWGAAFFQPRLYDDRITVRGRGVQRHDADRADQRSVRQGGGRKRASGSHPDVAGGGG